MLQMQHFGVRLDVRHSWLDMEIVKATSSPIVTNAEKRSALAKMANFLIPATDDHVETWLAELWVKVPPYHQPVESEARLTMRVYTIGLCDYPADVSHAAVMVKRWRKWPVWAHLAD